MSESWAPLLSALPDGLSYPEDDGFRMSAVISALVGDDGQAAWGYGMGIWRWLR